MTGLLDEAAGPGCCRGDSFFPPHHPGKPVSAAPIAKLKKSALYPFFIFSS
jgi:hypothetical protein